MAYSFLVSGWYSLLVREGNKGHSVWIMVWMGRWGAGWPGVWGWGDVHHSAASAVSQTHKFGADSTLVQDEGQHNEQDADDTPSGGDEDGMDVQDRCVPPQWLISVLVETATHRQKARSPAACVLLAGDHRRTHQLVPRFALIVYLCLYWEGGDTV